MAPLIVMLVISVGVRVIGFTGCGPGELIALGAACCARRDVSVYSCVAFSLANAAGSGSNGAAGPPATGSSGDGNRRARARGCRWPARSSNRACGGIRPDRTAGRDVSRKRPRRTAGPYRCRTSSVCAIWRLPLQLFWMWALVDNSRAGNDDSRVGPAGARHFARGMGVRGIDST